LLMPITKGLTRQRIRKVAYTELNEMETVIQAYKAKNGYYPPDNPTNALINPLYFELEGSVLSGGIYQTLDGGGKMAAASVQTYFGVGGFANSSTSAQGSDDKPAPGSFLKDLKPNQSGEIASGIKLLVCSVGWTGPQGTSPIPIPPALPSAASLAPWQYVSSSPTNNPNSYDLWVDLYMDGKTNRFSNWSKQPQIVP
jgi:hypothetical protein